MSSKNFYVPLREDNTVLHNNSNANGLNMLNDSLQSTQQRMSNRSPTNNAMMMTQLNSQDKSRSPSPLRPLINSPSAPLANIETDDETDERERVNRPYPGVDDGFFTNGNNGTNDRKPPDESRDPDVEFVPIRPKEPEETNHDFPDFPNIPHVTPRLGGDGDSVNPEDPNAAQPPAEAPKVPPGASNPDFPAFPASPGYRPWGWDLEVGATLPSGETIPDLNVYQHKKTLAQGMMDLALFSANANQLRYVLETFRTHPYYYPSVVLIAISLLLQVAVGVGLVWNATYNVRDQKALCRANKINNFTTICVFLVTVINVFISAFGVAPAPP